MNLFSRMMTAKSRFALHSEGPALHLKKHISVGAAEGCDLLILMPSNLSDISFKTPGCS
jgi:hypothetical protein